MIDFTKITETGKNVYQNLPPVKKRRNYHLAIEAIKIFLLFCLAIFVLSAALVLFNVFAFKAVFAQALAGKNNLQSAVDALKVGDYANANKNSNLAKIDFASAYASLQEISQRLSLKIVFPVSNQVTQANYLILDAKIISEAVEHASYLGVQYEKIVKSGTSYNQLSDAEKTAVLKLIYESVPELNGMKANLDLAILNFNNITYSGPIGLFKSRIELLKDDLIKADKAIDEAIPMCQMMPLILGYPGKSTFLVVLQNQDELRPTGGFIGTYGILETENGNISRFDTHDIYHLDMPVKDSFKVDPPAPLKKYLVDKWFMRDANWSPDFSESARQIELFFREEDKLLPPKNKINDFKGKLDGVFAVSSGFMSDLLKYSGPIAVGGEEYNQDNFQNLLQYKVEKGYEVLGVSSWQRKEVIGEIAKQLKLKIMEKPVKELADVFTVFSDNLNKKNILLSFKDQGVQTIADDRNWSGRVRSAPGDYLMVVDANLGSFKTDAVMNRKIEYNLAEKNDGLYVRLKISYAHHGVFDWKTTSYRTYTRILVPSGSRYIESKGFNESAKMETGKDSGKTVFSGFLKIDPGSTVQAEVYYKLPESIWQEMKRGNYQLMMQKQPGKIVDPLTVNLSFAKGISGFSPTGFYVQNENGFISWKDNFETDRNYSVNLN